MSFSFPFGLSGCPPRGHRGAGARSDAHHEAVKEVISQCRGGMGSFWLGYIHDYGLWYL